MTVLFRILVVLLSSSLFLVGCETGSKNDGAVSSPTAESPSKVTGEAKPIVTAAEGPVPFRPPVEAAIPEGPLGDSIRRGKAILTDTRKHLPENVGNGLSCKSCHLDAGRTPGAAPWVGIAAVFPSYRSRSASVATLQDRVNGCFQRSMNGKALPVGDPAMTDIMSYMTWLSKDVPIGRSVEGRGFPRFDAPGEPDATRGKAVYVAKCASCHGQDGQGLKTPDGAYTFPPLWGPESFNIGAGMARLKTAAAFVRANMPLGQGGTLTEQEAYDVALYFTRQPRPDFPAKSKDWPKGGKPSDARY